MTLQTIKSHYSSRHELFCKLDRRNIGLYRDDIHNFTNQNLLKYLFYIHGPHILHYLGLRRLKSQNYSNYPLPKANQGMK